ncbi:MAG: DUF3604 domain-containing protein [Spirochaetota bacterium]
MKTGTFTEFRNNGMMPLMITSSLPTEEHRRVWTRGEIRSIWRELLTKPAAKAKAHAEPDTVISGRRSSVTITITAEHDISIGGHIILFLPEFWGGIAQERDATTFFLWRSPNTYPGYVSSHISAHSEGDSVIEGTITSAGSVHVVADIAILDKPLRAGTPLHFVIGDTCGQGVLPIDFDGTYHFNVAVDAAGDGQYAAILPHPTVRVVGGTPERYRVTVPACSTEKTLPLRATAVDASLNHTDVDGTTKIIAHEQNTHRCVTVINETSGIAGKSNPSVRGVWADGNNVYFGEIHTHTELSDAIRSTDDAYRFARDTLGLDFAALSDHFEKHQPSMVYPADRKWDMTRDAASRFNEPGRFVTLLGYEWGGVPHINIYYRGADGKCFPADGETSKSPPGLYRMLNDEHTPYIAIPHHPKYLAAADWNIANGEHQRLVEIYSGWGSSEEGNDSAYRSSLAHGVRMGIIAGTDCHIGRPGQGNRTFEGGGLACVLAPSLTRENIFDALFARRCYGTTGTRMLIDFRVNGAIMGSETPFAKENIVSVRAIGEDMIERVDIVKNGTVVYSASPNRDEVSMEWKDIGGKASYYVRITQRDGHVGWSSPVWTCD